MEKGNVKTGNVVIPASYNNLTVFGIKGKAFESSGITGVTIPDSVVVIGYRAFLNCTRLTSVTIPNSVEAIGEEAFKGCTSLTSITIPNSVLQIYKDAFRGCSSLISVTFQGNINADKFHNQAFNGLGDLRAKYLKEGIGTYTRPNGKSNTWTKQ